MTREQIAELVNEAVSLDRTISDLQERQKTIKETLAGLARDLKGIETDGGGRSVVINGAECMARVVFPGPKLISSVKKKDKLWPRIVQVCGEHFRELFKAETVARPMEDFRAVAKDVLTAEEAKKLIALCETESSPTVSFEVTEKFGDDFP